MIEKKKFREKVSEKKTKSVMDIINLINESRSIIIVLIKNLPSSQFQAIKKSLRGKAVIKVTKKNIMARAIDGIEKGVIKNLKKYLKEDTAIVFSKFEPFELSAMMSKNKSMTKAKVGQVVEEDIIVEQGATELVPGPVISELSGLGIKFAIEDGKINIKEGKIIAKAGEKVNEAQVSIMTKFDMKPISVGLEPLIAYDTEEDKIYEGIKVDSEKIIEELKAGKAKAIAFAVKIVYYCKETIGYLLARAFAEENALEKFIKTEGIKQEENTQQNQNIQGG